MASGDCSAARAAFLEAAGTLRSMLHDAGFGPGTLRGNVAGQALDELQQTFDELEGETNRLAGALQDATRALEERDADGHGFEGGF
jgi:hypothetical protein